MVKLATFYGPPNDKITPTHVWIGEKNDASLRARPDAVHGATRRQQERAGLGALPAALLGALVR